MATADEKRGGSRVSAGAGAMRKSLGAAVGYVQGSVRALGAGSRAFQERFEPKRAFDPASPSNLLGALVAGAASYMESMAKVATDVAQRLRADEGKDT